MSELVPFKAEHIVELLREPMNKPLESWFTSGLVFDLEKADAFTFIYNGQVMICGGVTEYWTGRGQVWSVFSEKSKRNFVPCYRAIKFFLKDMIDKKYRRIELSVACDFDLGQRRAEMLGFSLETPLARHYLPGGEDCSLYALVRG